jgi:hypothetical protein
MSDGSRLILMGLRGSGKTSFLAAFWHLVEAGEVSSSFSADTLQPDRVYLNGIRDSWLKFTPVGRTPLKGGETVSLSLRDNVAQRMVEITLPDVSGERFRLQWTTRKVTVDYARYASECIGALLFVHPLQINKVPMITPMDTRPLIAGHNITQWSADDAPTQVQVVELLQILRYLRSVETPLRIAVIISAWDLVPGRTPPPAWLERNMPLLSQFLRSNPDVAPNRIYGVSALGGDLERDRQKLIAEMVPANRIVVIEEDRSRHKDLSTPLSFLLA